MIILLAELIGNAVTDKYQMLAVRLDRRIVIEHFLARKKSRMRIAAAGYSFPYRSRNGSIVSLCKLRKRERNICLPIEITTPTLTITPRSITSFFRSARSSNALSSSFLLLSHCTDLFVSMHN